MDIIDTAIKMFEEQSFDQYDIGTFVEILTKADDLYYNDDESFLTDGEYDLLRRFAESIDATNTYFIGVGSTVRGGKVQLPYTMGSLDQVYEGEIEDWNKKHNLTEEMIVITDKLDGTSAMVVYDKAGDLQIVYSRGNGTEGADITRHFLKIRNVPKNVGKKMVVRGEVIVERSTFPFIQERFKSRGNKPYKNARNFVAGIMNAKQNDSAIYDYIKFVAYQIIVSPK